MFQLGVQPLLVRKQLILKDLPNYWSVTMLYQDPPDPLSSPTPHDGSKARNTVAMNTCPVCETQFKSAGSSHLPFCSLRCRQIDLGRWLNESYGLPYENEDRLPPDEDWDSEE